MINSLDDGQKMELEYRNEKEKEETSFYEVARILRLGIRNEKYKILCLYFFKREAHYFS